MTEAVTCNFCNKEKPLNSFAFFKGKLHGKKCSECRSEYNKNKIKNASDEEKLAAKRRFDEWKARNPERKRKLNSKWKKENPDKVNAERRNRYAKDPSKDIEQSLKWAKENKDRVAHRVRKYYATKFNATPKWLNVAQLEEMQGFYHYGSIFGLEVDHIYPIKGKEVCGLHVPWNLQILSRSKNTSKGNRMPTQDMLSPYVEYLPISIDEGGFASMELDF